MGACARDVRSKVAIAIESKPSLCRVMLAQDIGAVMCLLFRGPRWSETEGTQHREGLCCIYMVRVRSLDVNSDGADEERLLYWQVTRCVVVMSGDGEAG
jgi:hypothetical protein